MITGVKVMPGAFENRVALVTGGGSGIGRAAALRLAKEAAKIVVADYVPEGAERTVKLINDAGGKAIAVSADVSVAADVQLIIRKTIEAFGRLDYAFDRTIAVNLKAVWLCMKYEIPEMLKVGGGAIVNTASTLGLVAIEGAAAYTAAKHGVIGLTRTAALEFAQKNIRVNCVCPGFTRTAMVERALDKGFIAEAQMIAIEPIGRLGRPEEIAEGVMWLLSDSASFVTGHALTIDGGWTAR